jgi:hypothetical protein
MLRLLMLLLHLQLLVLVLILALRLIGVLLRVSHGREPARRGVARHGDLLLPGQPCTT